MTLPSPYPEPPPYSRLQEDTPNAKDVPPTDGTSAPDASSFVTIQLQQKNNINNNNNDNKRSSSKVANRTVLRGFLCCCSLRSGCITITTIYALLTALHIFALIATGVSMYADRFLQFAYLRLNVVTTSLIAMLVITVLLSLGIKKHNPTYLTVSMWLMLVDVLINVLDAILMGLIHHPIMLVVALLLQTFPVYFILVVRSYILQLKKEKSLLPSTMTVVSEKIEKQNQIQT